MNKYLVDFPNFREDPTISKWTKTNRSHPRFSGFTRVKKAKVNCNQKVKGYNGLSLKEHHRKKLVDAAKQELAVIRIEEKRKKNLQSEIESLKNFFPTY